MAFVDSRGRGLRSLRAWGSFGAAVWAVVSLASGASSVGCAAGSEAELGLAGQGGDGGGTTQSGGGHEGGAGGSLFETAGAGAGTGEHVGDGCADAARPVYLLGQQQNLYRFDPATPSVTEVGVIDCPLDGVAATPFSMAVDRKGTAWVLFSNRRIYHVDVTTAACTPTDYERSQQLVHLFGMGFASNEAGSEEETLYVADFNGRGVAKLDTETLVLSPLVPYGEVEPGAAELTGTGDGRLFGFFMDTPSRVVQLDPATGSFVSQVMPPEIKIGSGWAFAFWGGEFYLFTNPEGAGSQVDRYSLTAGTKTTILTGINDNIVGAGVSTCAPTMPPQ